MSDPSQVPLGPTSGSDDVARTQIPPAGAQEIPDQAPSRPFEPIIAEPAKAEAAQTPSPMELAQGAVQRGAGTEVTPDSLHEGVTRLNSNIQSLKGELTPQRFSELTDAQKALLKTKLGQFGTSVQGLSQRLGIPYKTPQPKALTKDVKNVLDWLTQGQTQLETTGNALAKATPGKISVVGMLRAQAQLLAAERAINFATAIVSKGADFISRIMQTQL